MTKDEKLVTLAKDFLVELNKQHFRTGSPTRQGCNSVTIKLEYEKVAGHYSMDLTIENLLDCFTYSTFDYPPLKELEDNQILYKIIARNK